MPVTQVRLSTQALDLSLTTAKIAALAVTTAKIDNLAVTTAKIDGGAVTVDKLSDFRPTYVSVLDVAVAAGKIRNNNVVNSYAGSTVTVTNAATNYIEVDGAGSVSFNTTGFTASRFPIATAVAAGGVVTALTDSRTWATIVDNSTSSTFVTRETPTGAINGSNVTFTLANTPIVDSETVYLNGIVQNDGAGNDYTISGATITYLTAPTTGDILLVSYRY